MTISNPPGDQESRLPSLPVNPKLSPEAGRTSGTRPQVTIAVQFMAWLMVSGFVPIAVFSWQSGDFWRSVPIGLLVAVATCLLGALFGFIFAIPRSVQQGAKTPSAPSERRRYLPNTNLEEISDWLATVIVGVSLTQLTALPRGLVSLAEFLAQGLGSPPAATVAAIAIVVYYGIGGFLLGYLWTRLTFPRALDVAEEDTT